MSVCSDALCCLYESLSVCLLMSAKSVSAVFLPSSINILVYLHVSFLSVAFYVCWLSCIFGSSWPLSVRLCFYLSTSPSVADVCLLPLSASYLLHSAACLYACLLTALLVCPHCVRSLTWCGSATCLLVAWKIAWILLATVLCFTGCAAIFKQLYGTGRTSRVSDKKRIIWNLYFSGFMNLSNSSFIC